MSLRAVMFMSIPVIPVILPDLSYTGAVTATTMFPVIISVYGSDIIVSLVSPSLNQYSFSLST